MFEATREFARKLDAADSLARFRDEFVFPEVPLGVEKPLYFVGNSLGLQPKRAKQYVLEDVEAWGHFGVEGHFEGARPWLPYHEGLTENMAHVVGAKPAEVVVMNSLTVNLHLMLVSFYRPTAQRFKILIETDAFPSDEYAMQSQARFHGHDPAEAVLHMPRGSTTADWVRRIEAEGDTLALVMPGQVHYLTGRAFDLAQLAQAARARGAVFGVDLAHGAGNLLLKLHDWNVDFAVWCGYKYLNGGPGALAGAFVHERHHGVKLPRFEGWWGQRKDTRFQMGPDFEPIASVEAWQLSNPPIFSMAPVRASLEIFREATMPKLREKSERLTGFLEFLLERELGDRIEQLTPKAPAERGCQLSVVFKRFDGEKGKAFVAALTKEGVYCDFRAPNVLRFAPTPLYTRFEDVFDLVNCLRAHA